MYKVINDTKISFYDNNAEIMYIDFFTDECVWYFATDDVITITNDMELYGLLKDIMSQQYEFYNVDELINYKDDTKLVWYSDCYYNPDDEWSKNNVSYLTIEYLDGTFTLKCTKPLDNMINRSNSSHVIAFSPGGNGRITENKNTGSTLPTDFVIMIYQKLLKKEKTKDLRIK